MNLSVEDAYEILECIAAAWNEGIAGSYELAERVAALLPDERVLQARLKDLEHMRPIKSVKGEK